jgi:hypothetical protein
MIGADKTTESRRPHVRVTWSALLRWTTAAGLVCAITLWGWLPSAVAAVTIAVIAALWTWSLWADGDRQAIWRSIDAGVTAGVTATGLVALVAALGIVGLTLVLLLGGTAPILRSQVQARWLPPRFPSRAGVSTYQIVAPVVLEKPRLAGPRVSPTEDCETLDSAELVMAWRRSFVALQQAASRADQLAAVEQRQRCLDELYRRHPEGIASWLAAGARASGNPMPYLGDPPQRPR